MEAPDCAAIVNNRAPFPISLTNYYPHRIHCLNSCNLQANSALLIQLKARQTDSLGFNWL